MTCIREVFLKNRDYGKISGIEGFIQFLIIVRKVLPVDIVEDVGYFVKVTNHIFAKTIPLLLQRNVLLQLEINNQRIEETYHAKLKPLSFHFILKKHLLMFIKVIICFINTSQTIRNNSLQFVGDLY